MHAPRGGDRVGQCSKTPVGIDEWEYRLVRYFLAIDSDGDASDIRSLEVSQRTLALACGVEPHLEKEAEAAFHKALNQDPFLFEALKSGSPRLPTEEVPNCFVYLAMTLFIDTLVDSQNVSGNEFRSKLSDWLQINRAFSNLRGVALMWEDLATWLESRIAVGSPFRRLVLPVPPKSWKHIGYTRRLSFPNRGDVRLVAQTVERLSSTDIENPVVVLQAFAGLVSGGTVSLGLKDAFDGFRAAYYSNRRAIADHRFWQLVQQARSVSQRLIPQPAVFEITLTEDGDKEFRAIDEERNATTYSNLVDAVNDSVVASSSNLAASVRRGAIVFRQAGIGRWQAETDLSRCLGSVYLAFRVHHRRVLEQLQGRYSVNKNWCLTVATIPISEAEKALAAAGLLTEPATALFRPRVCEGVRVGNAWLGLPGFLPGIESDTEQIKVFCDDTETAVLKTQVEQGLLRITSETPLVGIFHVEPVLHRSESSSPWRLRMQLVDRAVPHRLLSGVRRELPLLSDWNSGQSEISECVLPEALRWEHAPERMEWLLEAVYASGASGWDEADLVHLVRRVDSESASGVWRILRALQDGGVLVPRLRERWKGRVWTLAAPHIAAACSSGKEVAILEGAVCAHMLEDFRHAAKGLGGEVFRFRNAAPWGVPVVGAVGLSANTLAERLGWESSEPNSAPSAVPLGLLHTERHGEHYGVAFSWCWRQRCFVRSNAIESTVRLEQLAHVSGTDHDVYRVQTRGKKLHYLSRNAAIVAAHASAGVPLFEFANEQIRVGARDGALPDALAAELRRRCLRAAGYDGQSYVYPASERDVRWLRTLLPRCIDGLSADDGLTLQEVLLTTRRSKGVRRLQWREGRLRC